MHMDEVPEASGLDATDRAIVTQLMQDGRASYARIGAAVGLSAPATKRRVDRLVARGAIRGFSAMVDPDLLGWHTEAYIEIFCRGNVSPLRMRDHFATIPEVVGACTVSGTADALLHVLARDVDHLEQTIQRIRALTGADSSRTEIVLSRLVDRGR